MFSLMHFLIASLSFINYFNPNVKQNQDYVAIAKIVSYMSITALLFNIVVLFYGGIIDHTSAIYALKYLTLPSAASSITLLILLSLNTVNVFMHNQRLNRMHNYIYYQVPRNSVFIPVQSSHSEETKFQSKIETALLPNSDPKEATEQA